MGNVISSVNSTFQRIGTSYMEYTKNFHSYWYECPSYPLIENIVNGVILVPCKCLLVLPIAVVKIPQKWPMQTLIVLYSCYSISTVGIKSFIITTVRIGAGALCLIKCVDRQAWVARNVNEEDYNDALNRWARRSVRYSGDAPGTYRYCPNRPMPDDYLLPGATPFIWFGWNQIESPASSLTISST